MINHFVRWLYSIPDSLLTERAIVYGTVGSALFCVLLIVLLVAAACAAPSGSASQQGVGWNDLGGGISSRDINPRTTCYIYNNSSASLSCVYHS